MPGPTRLRTSPATTRLQVTVGVPPRIDADPHGPDWVEIVAPPVGAISRTKGRLYLLVSSRPGIRRPRDLARSVAVELRRTYYYDESAGIKVCLEKAVAVVRQRLLRVRPWSAEGSDGGPISLALAVVRDGEVYATSLGGAQVYVVRGGRPILPPIGARPPLAGGGRATVWRAELAVGDAILLVSPSLLEAVGIDPLVQAATTLHPQAAVEAILARAGLGEPAPGAGILVLGVGAVPATEAGTPPTPAYPPAPREGDPERSPIPFADAASAGLGVLGRETRHLSGWLGRWGRLILLEVHDRLPGRRPTPSAVTPATVREETRRRAAAAVLVLVAVAALLGLALWHLGPAGPPEALQSLSAAQAALKAAQDDLNRVRGGGIDLTETDPSQALVLLTDAYTQLDRAGAAGVPEAVTAPLREEVVSRLDRLFHVVPVVDTVAFRFPPGATPTNLQAIVRGPDGVPYVLDATAQAVYRIDLRQRKAQVILRAGQRVGGVTVAPPRFIAPAGPDLYILDRQNSLWRWRPADQRGHGTLIGLRIREAAAIGSDVAGMATYCRNPPDCDLNNLYLVDPSSRQILAFAPAADGSGYPGAPTLWLAAPRDLGQVGGMVIDGDLYLVDGGTVVRYTSGRTGEWSLADPGDELLRPAPVYAAIAATGGWRSGTLYGFDARNGRLLAFDKASGAVVAQYRPVDGPQVWAGLRGFYVVPEAAGSPAVMVWAAADSIHVVPLEPVGTTPEASPSPSPSAAPASPAASARRTPRPTATSR